MEEKETPIKLHRRNSAEENRKVRERAVWGSKEMREFRESIKTQYGVDIKTDIPVKNFSWPKFREKVMRETNSASGNAQLLRAGLQTLVNSLYTAVPTTYEKWTHVVQSNKDTELYAPLNALSFPGELGEGERYIESNVVGLDIKLRNKKYGQMFPVTKELIEDDQTGQMIQKVSEMADYAAMILEVLALGKLGSPTGGCSYGGLSVPVSETKPSTESNYPWASSSATLIGGGITKPTSFGAMTQANIQSGFTVLENQLNLQGLKMNVSPDSILTGPFNRWTLATLLNSNFYPSGAAAAGAIGGALAINVLQGIAEPIISRFIFDQNGSATANSKAWYILDSSKPAFVVQLRTAAEVTQEDPNSGASFERDVSRWKLRVRANADFIDPRFFFQGSDGSA